MKVQAVCKFLTNVYVNPIKTFFSNTTSPISSHSVDGVVAYSKFLSNKFPINPTIHYISPKPIINTSVKSIIPLDRKFDDISIHKSAIPGTLFTPKVDSTLSSSSTTFLTLILSLVLLKFLLNLLHLVILLPFAVITL